MLEKFYSSIRDVPDFPKPGILFKDITPLLLDIDLFRSAVERIAEPFRGQNVDKVLGIESRGFILGMPVAMELGAGFVPARKEGKLPWERMRVEYELEYGTDALEIHADGIRKGERTLIVDDVLATGGTAAAASQAVREAGGELLGAAFLIELEMLNGRARLNSGGQLFSLLKYPRE